MQSQQATPTLTPQEIKEAFVKFAQESRRLFNVSLSVSDKKAEEVANDAAQYFGAILKKLYFNEKPNEVILEQTINDFFSKNDLPICVIDGQYRYVFKKDQPKNVGAYYQGLCRLINKIDARLKGKEKDIEEEKKEKPEHENIHEDETPYLVQNQPESFSEKTNIMTYAECNLYLIKELEDDVKNNTYIKSDKKNLYLYKDIKNENKFFYFLKGDKHKYYLDEDQSLSELLQQAKFTNLQENVEDEPLAKCNDNKITNTVFDITLTRGHTLYTIASLQHDISKYASSPRYVFVTLIEKVIKEIKGGLDKKKAIPFFMAAQRAAKNAGHPFAQSLSRFIDDQITGVAPTVKIEAVPGKTIVKRRLSIGVMFESNRSINKRHRKAIVELAHDGHELPLNTFTENYAYRLIQYVANFEVGDNSEDINALRKAGDLALKLLNCHTHKDLSNLQDTVVGLIQWERSKKKPARFLTILLKLEEKIDEKTGLHVKQNKSFVEVKKEELQKGELQKMRDMASKLAKYVETKKETIGYQEYAGIIYAAEVLQKGLLRHIEKCDPDNDKAVTRLLCQIAFEVNYFRGIYEGKFLEFGPELFEEIIPEIKIEQPVVAEVPEVSFSQRKIQEIKNILERMFANIEDDKIANVTFTVKKENGKFEPSEKNVGYYLNNIFETLKGTSIDISRDSKKIYEVFQKLGYIESILHVYAPKNAPDDPKNKLITSIRRLRRKIRSTLKEHGDPAVRLYFDIEDHKNYKKSEHSYKNGLITSIQTIYENESLNPGDKYFEMTDIVSRAMRKGTAAGNCIQEFFTFHSNLSICLGDVNKRIQSGFFLKQSLETRETQQTQQQSQQVQQPQQLPQTQQSQQPQLPSVPSGRIAGYGIRR